MEDEQLTIAMCVFKRHNKPAENVEESNEQLTTREILEKFTGLLGDNELDAELMYDLLTQHGFIFDYFMDEFRWLIKTEED